MGPREGVPIEGGVHKADGKGKHECPSGQPHTGAVGEADSLAVILRPQTFLDGLTTTHQDLPPSEKKNICFILLTK